MGLLHREGITIDSSFYAARGVWDDDPDVYEYDPGLVKGFDAIRDEDDRDNIVGSKVSNHDEAVVDGPVSDDRIEAVLEKFRDGLGIQGPAVRKEPEPADDEPEPETEPMADEEVAETIRENFAEHGFFAEDEDGDAKVVSLASPDARLMGYITGSHVKALPNGLESVDDYRRAVYQALVGDAATPDDELVSLELPSDVPIATSDMMETFEEAGRSLAEDEDLADRMSGLTKARWEDGEYDHLKNEDPED